MSSPVIPEALCLHVVVVSATGLYKKDLFGLCDPYVKVSLKRKKGTTTAQTKKRKKTLSPEWNEKVVFNDVSTTNDSILFEVFDENKLTRDNFLGKLHFKLQHVPIEIKKMDIMRYERSATYQLKPRSHKSRVSGSLVLKFLYYNTPPPRQSSNTNAGGFNLASLVEGSTGRSSPQEPRPASRTSSITTQSSVGGASASASPPGSSMDLDEDDPLPTGWEERQDANGRTFFVDHINRRTQWNRPTRSAEEVARQQRGQMEADRRRMMAQTLARRNPGMSGSESVQDLSMSSLSLNSIGSAGMPNGSPRGSPVSSRNSIAITSSSSPVPLAVMQAPPISPTLQAIPPPLPPRTSSMSGAPALPPPRSGSLTSTSPVIPRLPPPPSRNTSLSSRPASSLAQVTPSQSVSPSPATPNTAASSPGLRSVSPSPQEEALPEGWEMRRAANGRPFYIDHNTRKTQWHKPTAPVARPRPQSAIISSGQSLVLSPSTLVSTPISSGNPSRPPPVSSPTPPSAGQNGEDLGPLPPGWDMRLLPDGRKFYIEHATKSTQWEDPRLQQQKKEEKQANTPYSRHYKQKYEALRKRLVADKPENLPRIFEIPVRRQHLFEDSHRAIMNCKNLTHLKARLWVKFDGEKGLDYGGVSREWFFLLSHEMFNPYYGLFEYSASDNYTLQINPESGFCNEHHLEYFRFIGRVLAMAIYHQRLIDAFFVRPFYKMLAGKRILLEDMEMVDTEFYNSIKYILENDPEPLCLTFTANREFMGKVEEVELKKGGQDIEVTESNRKEYIDLLMKWRFENRIKKQMDSLKKGFNEVISTGLLNPFDAQEIEYLICGIGEINVEDWRKHTVYAAGYKAEDNVIMWFWKAVQAFDSEMKARLLQFVTGTSKVPMNGFGELQGSNGPQKFCIKKLGEPTALPRSHTCFNRIDLPPYRSYHELKEKLRLAIENTEGFEGVD